MRAGLLWEDARLGGELATFSIYIYIYISRGETADDMGGKLFPREKKGGNVPRWYWCRLWDTEGDRRM